MFETDDWLIKQILLKKDRAAGEKLVERYYKKIYREVYLKTGDEELAKDLTQESFIQILKNLHMFDSSKAAFKTWIVTIARNKVIDYMRSRQHHEIMMTDVLEDYEQEDSVNIEQQAVDRMAAQQVENLLETEKTENKDIFRMKAQQGYTFSEVSSMTGMADSSVKNRYYSIVKKLRKELRDYE
jgi:RNA polymerase sigma-70 factor (ECF subfamily)